MDRIASYAFRKYPTARGIDQLDGHEGREAEPISTVHMCSKPPNSMTLSILSPYHIHGGWREIEIAEISGRNISPVAAPSVSCRGCKEWVREDKEGMKVD